MDKRTIEGSPERAADRGRAEDLGWDMGALPSLGDPDVVRGLVQDFATEVIGARADYNGDKLTGPAASGKVLAAAKKYGDIVMGRSEDFTALPWNDPARLGRRIRQIVAVAEDADPGEAIFLELGRSISELAAEHEAGRISDQAAQSHLQEAIQSVATALMGYPR